MTIEQEWQRYKSLAYPAVISPRQAEEMRKAFVAGSGSMFASMYEKAKQPKAKALEALEATTDDIMKELQAYASKSNQSN